MDARPKNMSLGTRGVLVTPVECYRYARKHTYKQRAIIIPCFLPLSLFPWIPAVGFLFFFEGKENIQNKTTLTLSDHLDTLQMLRRKFILQLLVDEQVFSHSYHLSHLIILGYWQISMPNRCLCALACFGTSPEFCKFLLRQSHLPL